jgi:hypothetical protein
MRKTKTNKDKSLAQTLSPYFLRETANNRDFAEALAIAKTNSGGKKIWAIGGLVYRNIVQGLYGRRPNQTYDFDFIVESPVPFEQLSVPSPWRVFRTGLGEPRFVSGRKQLDLVPLDSAATSTGQSYGHVTTMTIDKKLESYFRRVPLTVQAVAYDVESQKIVGEIGAGAILDQKIKVNNLDECLSFCQRRRISIREFMTRKGETLQFSVVYPSLSDPRKTETKEFYEIHSKEYAKTRGENQNPFITGYLAQEVNLFLRKLREREF